MTRNSVTDVVEDKDAGALKQALANMHVEDVSELHDAHAEEEVDEQGRHPGGGYHFDTPEHKEQLKAQRHQLWNWLKSVGQHMFREGINLTRISLPVCLFEPRSFLERLTANFEYMDLLTAAGNSTCPIERMRYVVAFAVSGLCRQVSFHKPFNPILGETFQASYPNGTEVFCEQISHHPPVSAWEVFDAAGKFQFYGVGNWTAGIKGNSVKGRQTGTNCVHFKSDDAKITYELPGLQVKGVLWGTRVLKYSGEMVFKDEKNGLECRIEVDPPQHAGFLSGWFRAKKPAAKPDQVTGTLKKNGAVVDTCTGNWLGFLEWEKGAGSSKSKRIWDINKTPVSLALPVKDALPSDCRNREDLVHLKAGDQGKAQDWKHKLEEIQRRDRKLRKEGGGYEN